MDQNSYQALLRRRDAGTLTWRSPALMLFARAACAVGAPVYGTLIDAGSLALLWRLIRREGIRLWDLVGFALIPACLVFMGMAVHLGADRANDL